MLNVNIVQVNNHNGMTNISKDAGSEAKANQFNSSMTQRSGGILVNDPLSNLKI